jgi:hypothetical protein
MIMIIMILLLLLLIIIIIIITYVARPLMPVDPPRSSTRRFTFSRIDGPARAARALRSDRQIRISDR